MNYRSTTESLLLLIDFSRSSMLQCFFALLSATPPKAIFYFIRLPKSIFIDALSYSYYKSTTKHWRIVKYWLGYRYTPFCMNKKLTESPWGIRRLRSKPINRIQENQNHKTTCLVYHPDKFGDIRYCDKWDLMLLVSHILSYNDLPKWSCDFIVGSPSP